MNSDIMFSVMGLSLTELQESHRKLITANWLGEQYSGPKLPLGVEEVDALLPGGGLPRGQIVEFAVTGTAAWATSLSLAACRSAQQSTQLRGQMSWCAFVDPSRSLYGPGVVNAGVELSRLLVVQPTLEGLEKAAFRLVDSQAFSVVVVDTVGVPGAPGVTSLSNWPRVVRRLALAIGQSHTLVVLITDKAAPRPLPLPTGMRIELTQEQPGQLLVHIAKDRQGHISAPKRVVLSGEHSIAGEHSGAREHSGTGVPGAAWQSVALPRQHHIPPTVANDWALEPPAFGAENNHGRVL